MKLKDKLNEISHEVADVIGQKNTEENSRLLLLTQNHVKWLKSNFKDELTRSAPMIWRKS